MKKFFALLLSVLTISAMFAACNPQNKQESTDKENTLEISLPYKGEPIRFKGFGYDGLKINEETPVLKAWREKVGNIFIDWEMVPYSDFQEKSKIYLSSGNMPDVMPIYDPKVVVVEYGSSRLLDFSKYEKYMPNLQNYRKGPEKDFVNSILNEAGQRFAILGIQATDYPGEGWQVNKTILDEAGAKVPDTFDELIDALRKVKAKHPDVIPLQSYWNIGYLQSWIGNVIDAERDLFYYDPEAKKWQFAYDDSNAKRKELIETMAMLYSEKLINPEIATMSNEQEEQQLATGKWGVYAGYNSSIMEFFKAEKALGGNPIPFELVSILPPKTAAGNRNMPLAYLHDAMPGWGMCASNNVKNPEYLAAYLDLVVSPFGKELWNFGVEGVTFDKVDGKNVLKDNIDKEATGYQSQYEIWHVGMGPDERITKTSDKFYIDMWNKSLEAFKSGEMKAYYQKGIPVFNLDVVEDRSSMENDLKTYVAEQEAKFIYGTRPLSEWEKYVGEIKKYVDTNKLLDIYNNKARTIDISGERIWQDFVK